MDVDKYPDHQPGSICRLYLRNFMQYAECELKPGATLNVILGPNGSGKSSVVNGLALALGSKTAVLGRAELVDDFIRTGCDEAELEVELKGTPDDGENVVIRRRWKRGDTRTLWTVNGRKSSHKEVLSLVVRKFNIQTDNLCQFLPQDKVHDFSKMNSKELLSKTIDAVGAQQLRSDHESLKSIQQDLKNKEERFKAKQHVLLQHQGRVQTMEGDVENFEQKEKIQKDIELLKKRKYWAQVKEAFGNVEAAKEQRDAVAKKIKNSEEELKPILKEIKSKESEVQKSENLVRELVTNQRKDDGTIRQKGLRFQSLQDEVATLEDKLTEAQDQAQEREEHIKILDNEIARIRREYESESANATAEGSAEEISAQICTCQADKRQLSADHTTIQSKLSEQVHEKRSLESKITRLRDAQSQLLNVEQQKKDIMKEMPQGPDTLRALEWLEENRDGFKGRVYSPILFQINVHDGEKNAVYLESCVPPKDLVAFAAENADDANALMNELRNKQRLRVNVVQVNDAESNYRTPGHNFGPEMGFQGYVSDMFDAPAAIKNYLCKLYALHQIPVFDNKANKSIERLVYDFKLRSFFSGGTKHNCTKSKYSSQLSTTSNKAVSRKWLQVSLDKTKVNQIEKELAKTEDDHAKVQTTVRDLNTNLKNVEREIEAKRQEVKSLQQKLNFKKSLKTRWQVKEKEKAEYMNECRPVDVEEVKRKIEVEKRRKFREMARLNDDVAALVSENTDRIMTVQLEKLRMIPAHELIDELRRDHGERDRALDVIRINLGEEKENVRIVTDAYRKRLEKAQYATDPSGGFKGDFAPESLVDQFVAQGLDRIGCDECKIQIQELDARLQCMEDVDPDLVKEYKALKKEMADLEQELESWEVDFERRKESMVEIRDRWLAALNQLVEEISSGFSEFFETMGFAGEVQLGHADDINDFNNYGIDVLVKFRDNVQMQKLDPFQQSGGERSVSTALYMMALQHLTKVPFRCVDEINQGMDAKNERRVFDMLIETSVKKNTAQYFLLTPKLLPDLQYDLGVTVIIVYNGDSMCNYQEWDNDKFVSTQQNLSQMSC